MLCGTFLYLTWGVMEHPVATPHCTSPNTAVPFRSRGVGELLGFCGSQHPVFAPLSSGLRFWELALPQLHLSALLGFCLIFALVFLPYGCVFCCHMFSSGDSEDDR